VHTPMSREQRRLAEAMRATVADYGDVLRSRDAYAGGMQWLTAKGHTYLSRYRQDPLTGEKKATSLGRRTSENEKVYDAFMKERAELDERIAVLRPVMAEQARMARALRLTRAPSEVGGVLRAIGTSDLVDRLTLAGDAAVFAYETEMASLLPRDVLPDEGLDLIIDGIRATDQVEELAAVLRRAKILVRPGRGRGDELAVLRTEENLKITLITPSSMERMVEGYESSFAGDTPRWALEQSPIRSVVIDRTGRAATVAVFDPRAWCILRSVSLEMREMSPNARGMAAELVSATASMVHEKMPFEEEQVYGFRPLLDALEGEEFVPPPRF
jgi:hypothetical protein